MCTTIIFDISKALLEILQYFLEMYNAIAKDTAKIDSNLGCPEEYAQRWHVVKLYVAQVLWC